MYSEVDWKIEIEKSHLPLDVKSRMLLYIDKCQSLNTPVIINLLHLSALVGIDHEYIKRMVNSPENFYYEFSIPKKSGKTRNISAPYPSISSIQKWIAETILSKYILHDSAKAYIKGRSILNHAGIHAKNYSVLVMDLKDFFPSISQDMVKDVFLNLGYPDHISYFFARICTLHKSLPQGAPSSPIISNIVTLNIDNLLSQYCSDNNILYSRYADDLCFSKMEDLSIHKTALVNIVESMGFRINDRKTRIINGFGKKKIVTGISIGSGKVKLPRKLKRKWRIEVHQIVTKGLDAHLRHIKVSNPLYLEKIIGQLQYWKFLEPNNPFVQKKLNQLLEIHARKNN